MKDLTQRERRILEMLRFGNLRAAEIASHLNISTREVSRIIAQIRKKFTNGDANASYVYVTKQGYSLEETPEHVKYEGMLRLKRGTSLILNGKYVYNRCRQIDLGGYNSLRLEFYPKAAMIVSNFERGKEDVKRGQDAG